MLGSFARRTLRLSARRARNPVGTRGFQVYINDKPVETPNGSTIMYACQLAGFHIPRFCFHERLSIAGNCRMCLVDVAGMPKPMASCAQPAMPGMKIYTDSDKVKKMREGVLEFLLANHPVDCPICDQGGECDLQDQAFKFGNTRVRYREFRKTTEDKDFGPLIETHMTRCIHCTRCVRFSEEIAGVPVLGATGRGGSMEIGTYVDKVFDSELSGNVIDLCPVGALNSKPYAYTARPWELQNHDSIDVFDAVGSNIRCDVRTGSIRRTLPRLHEDLNEEWISDKIRFSFDGWYKQRLDTPMTKLSFGSDVEASENAADSTELRPVSTELMAGAEPFLKPTPWEIAFKQLVALLGEVKGTEIACVAGQKVDAETLIAAKDLMNRLGCSNLYAPLASAGVDTTNGINADLRPGYLTNTSVANLDQADVVLLVGTNPRMEAPLLNARLRKAVYNNDAKVGVVGPPCDLAFMSRNFGNNTAVVSDMAAGKHPFAKFLKEAERPAVVLGVSALRTQDTPGLLKAVSQMEKSLPNLRNGETGWDGVNVLHTAASSVAALDVGFVPGPHSAPDALSKAKVVFLVGADEEHDLDGISSDAVVVYIGSHGDAGASRADIVLPSTSFHETGGVYVNTEGRVQESGAVLNSLPHARDEWTIFKALSDVLGVPLPYESRDQVRMRLRQVCPTFEHEDSAPGNNQGTGPLSHSNEVRDLVSAQWGEQKTSAGKEAFTPMFKNFYQTDPITRASSTMARAAAELPVAGNSYIDIQQIPPSGVSTGDVATTKERYVKMQQTA